MASPEKESESWADETSAATESRTQDTAVKAEAEKDMSKLANAQTDGAAKVEKDTSEIASAQADGATEALHGTSGIYEPSYEVNVLLSDLQADPNNPLNSIKTFEDLGL